MNILALDIGGKTRNGLCLMDSDTCKIIAYTYIPYDTSKTPLEHRANILQKINEFNVDYGVDCIVFERINLFRGQHLSHLSNIISLCRVQTTIIDSCSAMTDIYDIAVKSWKSKVLKNGSADKEDSINFIKRKYPEVDLDITIHYKRKADEIIKDGNHDLADSICIAYACCISPGLLTNKNKLNYQ